eukprot:PhF_6_TR8627/c0_g1_i2/m.13466
MSIAIPYGQRIQRMYETYCPAKLYKIPSLLQQYEGRERELLNALITKYGEEPSIANGLNMSSSSSTSFPVVSTMPGNTLSFPIPMTVNAGASPDTQFQRRKVQYIVDMHRSQRCELQCRIRDLEAQLARQDTLNTLQEGEMAMLRDGTAAAKDYNATTQQHAEDQCAKLASRVATLKAQIFDLQSSRGLQADSLVSVSEYLHVTQRVSILENEKSCLRKDLDRLENIAKEYLKLNPDAVM